ncbi:MAG: TadE/TadG family type IV pilus assembly protein [Acidimicrobiia bacterium]|nr:TadE/TadG family type IV pilus assembly protein [Acidimicrobiia bacterium]
MITRRKEREQGAALVEMAMVLPLLVLLVFGIVEFGLAFNKRLTVGNASQSAARVGSAIANNEYADISLLESLEQGLIALPNAGQDVVKTVHVYEANSAGNPVGGCPSTTCNVYTYSYNPSGCNWTPCPDPDPPVNFDVSTLSWSPEDRSATVGSLDVLGVRVFFSHTWITGGFPLGDVTCSGGTTDCWQDTAIMRLEPQQLGVSGP